MCWTSMIRTELSRLLTVSELKGLDKLLFSLILSHLQTQWMEKTDDSRA